MTGNSKVVGMAGIDFTKWSTPEIVRLIEIAQTIVNERNLQYGKEQLEDFEKYYKVGKYKQNNSFL